MNARPTAFLFQARLILSIMRRIMQRLALQLIPVIAAYVERGSVAALSVAAMWLAQSIRNRMASTALSSFLHRPHGKWNHFITKSVILIKEASSDIIRFLA